MTHSDAALLNSWRHKRDADAFRTLTQRYAGMVYASCRRILNNPAEAEDAAQECFEILATSTKPVEDYLAPWLHRVACNRALTRLRSERRRVEREARFAASLDADRTCTWDDIYSHVDEAIEALPEELRLPVVAHFLEGQTHAAIAEILATPRSTISYRIEKGVDHLRQTLQVKGVTLSAVALMALLVANTAEAAPPALLASLGKLALSGAGHAAARTAWKLPFLFKTKSLVTLAASLAIPIVGATLLMRAGTIPSLGSATARPVTQEVAERQAMRESRRATSGMPHPGVKGQPKASFAAMPQEPGGGVSGRVFNPDTGRGLAFAVVGVDGPSGEIEVLTSPFGNYSFKNLAPGRYQMYCYAAFGYVNGYHNEEEVDVPPGAVVEDVDFERSMGVNVSGHVRDEQGRPVEGVYVTADHHASGPSKSATTWSDGSFTLTRIFTNQPGVRFAADGNGMISDWSQPWNIGTAHLSGVEIVMRKAARISGTLVNGAGQPVPGTKLLAWPNEGGRGRIHSATTDAQGNFDIQQVAEGNLSITVSPEGSSNRINNVLDTLDVATGESVTGLVVVLDESQGLRIAGTVTDPQGKPLAGKLVECFGPVTDGRSTDANGRYEFTRLPEGYYSLLAERQTRVRDLFLPDGKELDIVLGNTTTVQCRVVDKATGQPVRRFRAQALADFPASLSYELDRLPHVYDAEGRFWVDLEPGGYNIAVRARGYAVATAPVKVAAGAAPPNEVAIALEPAAPLVVEVLDPQGMLLAGAKVWTMIESGPNHSNKLELGKTADDGTLRCDWQPPNDGHIYASRQDYAMGFVEWPKNGPARIQLGQGGVVTGTVQTEGPPPIGINVGIVLPGEKAMRELYAEVSDEGSFELQKVPAGELTVQASAWWRKDNDTFLYQVLSETIEVADGATTAVDLHLRPGTGVISGTALLDGQPFAMNGVKAKYQTEDGREYAYSINTAKDGSFRLDGLPEGKAEVSLTDSMFYQSPRPKNPMEPFELTLTPGQEEQVTFELSMEDF